MSYVGEVGEEIVVTRWRVDLRYGLTFGKLAIYVCVYVCVLLHFHSLLLSHLLQICGKSLAQEKLASHVIEAGVPATLSRGHGRRQQQLFAAWGGAARLPRSLLRRRVDATESDRARWGSAPATCWWLLGPWFARQEDERLSRPWFARRDTVSRPGATFFARQEERLSRLWFARRDTVSRRPGATFFAHREDRPLSPTGPWLAHAVEDQAVLSLGPWFARQPEPPAEDAKLRAKLGLRVVRQTEYACEEGTVGAVNASPTVRSKCFGAEVAGRATP